MNLFCNQWRIQDFPEEGAPTLQGGRQHTILPNFRKNCMKLKEFGLDLQLCIDLLLFSLNLFNCHHVVIKFGADD